MSDYISEDLVREILARLAAKELIRFRCVCRIWNSLISSRSFLTYHLNTKNANKEDLHIFDYFTSGGHVATKIISLRSIDNAAFFDPINQGEEIQFSPFKTSRIQERSRGGSVAHFVGCCNGLLCFKVVPSYSNEIKIVVWNPRIRKCRILVETKMIDPPRLFFQGFGYDPITCDCKLIRGIGDKIEVFSESRGSWREIATTPRRNLVQRLPWKTVSLNGAWHFLFNTSLIKYTDKFEYLILAVDVHKEQLVREMAIPVTNGLRCFLLSPDGLLSLVIHNWTNRETSFWVMKEYGVAESWTKLFNISESLGYISLVVASWANWEALSSSSTADLASCDPFTPFMKSLDLLDGAPQDVRNIHCSSFMESLALLDGVPQQDMERSLQKWEKKCKEDRKQRLKR